MLTLALGTSLILYSPFSSISNKMWISFLPSFQNLTEVSELSHAWYGQSVFACPKGHRSQHCSGPLKVKSPPEVICGPQFLSFDIYVWDLNICPWWSAMNTKISFVFKCLGSYPFVCWSFVIASIYFVQQMRIQSRNFELLLNSEMYIDYFLENK